MMPADLVYASGMLLATAGSILHFAEPGDSVSQQLEREKPKKKPSINPAKLGGYILMTIGCLIVLWQFNDWSFDRDLFQVNMLNKTLFGP